ncbi:helix-hairpin-helix domain-containing protein [Stigmatella sp. ncwal1]|uniref:Helix-hairpin-helix domain-containing protein n=1 Tax=Stigmatella ashevillensis TaxID=2995309 RepID=A0ABT5DEL9_9BACT|nr:helix-hairpin-helix domain-containing protein [Stigmatella ashevillena]MDC0710762.1 helix-hairpin-helix domain-containing protein [Stigmatella ashevillena]
MRGPSRRLAWTMVLALGLLGSGTAAAREKTRTQYTGVVNLNEATEEELDRLPGVGSKAAQRILAQRAKRRFQRPEELVKVKGFGKKKFQKLKPFLTVTGPSTLTRATARAEASPQKPAK